MTTNSLAFRLFATAAAWTLLILPIAGAIIYSLYKQEVETSFDRRIRALNARYLGTRRATDVLAFDLAGPGPGRLWGEVIVSAETAARHARRLRVPLAVELDLLVVHGLLHLAGYDDHDPRRARRMHERAREILAGRSARAVPARLWAGLLEA